LLANGQGVGRSDGIVVFCFGPLPEERARVRVTEIKQRYAVAEMRELLAVSPARARPFCAVFGTCGGCQLQHLDYAAQLAWKRDAVRQAFARIGGLGDIAVNDTVGMANPRAYRNKMSLVIDDRGDAPALGFYRQRSHDVVPIAECPVVTPELNAGLARLDATRRAPIMKAMLAEAKHLVARSSRATGESVLTITTADASESAKRAAPAVMNDFPGLIGVTNSFELSSANAIVGRRHRVLAGEPAIEERIGDVSYRVSAASFFQVNVEMVSRRCSRSRRASSICTAASERSRCSSQSTAGACAASRKARTRSPRLPQTPGATAWSGWLASRLGAWNSWPARSG
jgi:23S rRNA (uracil1939-C5)-methyltransferase